MLALCSGFVLKMEIPKLLELLDSRNSDRQPVSLNEAVKSKTPEV